MSGGPGWIRTINLPIQSRALHWLSYRATIRQPELHRSLADTSGVRRFQRFGGIENGRAPRCCPEYLADPNGADCCLPRARGCLGFTSKWWSHGESHPDLRNAIASSCCWTMAPKSSARPDSHRIRAGLQAAASTISASRAFLEMGRPAGAAPVAAGAAARGAGRPGLGRGVAGGAHRPGTCGAGITCATIPGS